MGNENQSGWRSFIGGEALEPYRRVRLSSSTENTIVYADAGEPGIGVTDGNTYASGAVVNVKLWSAPGTFQIEAVGAIVCNALFYGAADGKISATAYGPVMGFVLATGEALSITECVMEQPFGRLGAWMLPGATTSIADALAIPVTHGVVAKTTGADAEALTLADGTPGQELLIYLATDGGGDGTLTPATCSGFATIVFADAGDGALLRFVDPTIGWIIVGLYGVAAPPATS